MSKRSRRNEVSRRPAQQIQAIRQELSIGPLPHPSILAAYEQIHPGAANRIITMAENQQAMAARALDSDIADRKAGRSEAFLGQLFGFLLGALALGCGTYVASIGAELSGGLMGTGGVVALVAVFVYGRRSQKGDK